MRYSGTLAAALATASCVVAFATPAAAQAQSFRIPAGDLRAALDAYVRQAGVQIVYRVDQLRTGRTAGVSGVMSPDEALRTLLAGSGFEARRDQSGAMAIVRSQQPLMVKSSYSGMADAQPAPAAAPAEDDRGSGQLEEIIVTARRKEESLLSVPVAVSAVSAKEIARSGVSDMQRVAKMVPQVIITESPSGAGASYTIRGLGSPPLDPGLEQSVLTMLDGTPITRGRVVLAGMFDIAQVEVLKGPQAVFFGKNSPAGVVSISSAVPTDKFEGYARVGYEFEAREKYLEAAISGPLSDTFAARVAIRASDMDGWLHNLAASLPAVKPTFFPESAGRASARLPGTRELMGRITLRWTPSSNFDATLRVTGGDRKDKGYVNQQWCDPDLHSAPVTVGGVPDPTDGCKFDDKALLSGVPSQYVGPDWEGAHADGKPFGRLKSLFTNLTANVRTDDLTFTSVTSYWTFDYASMGGYDYTSYGLANSAIGEKAHSFAQELRLVSDFDGPLNFSLGAFYENGHRRNPTDSLLVLVGPVAAGLPGAGRYDNFNSQNYADWKTLSGFGQLRWAITDGVELAGGVRYTKETRRQVIENRFVHPVANVFFGPFVPVGLQFHGKFRDTNWSPEATLSYKPAPDVLIYAAYKTGYKSGGFPSLSLFKLKPAGAGLSVEDRVPVSSDLVFGPEKAKGGEIGFKAQLFDRKVRVEATAYLYNYNNLQESNFNPNTFSFTVQNAASARVKGVELQTQFAATRELRLNASVAYNEAKFRSYPNAPCYTAQTVAQGCVGGSQVLTGRPLPRAPKWNVIAGFSYDAPVADNVMVGLSGDVSYRSKYVLQETASPFAVQKGFALWNGGVRLYTADDAYELAFIARNIANKHYAEFSSNTTFAQQYDQLHGGTPRGRELRVQGTFRF